MEFISFPEQTVEIAKDQKEYLTLPAHQVGDDMGTTFMKIKFSPEEIEYINRTGCSYVSVATFGKKFGQKADKLFPPIMFYARNPFPILQPVTDELSVIYFKDIDLVYFYSPDGLKQLLIVESDKFTGEWIPSIGFKSFGFFRIEKDMFGKVKIQVTWNQKQGVTVKLNNMFYNRED